MTIPAITLHPRFFDLTPCLAGLGNLLFGPAAETVRRGSLDSSSFVRVDRPFGRRVTCINGSLWLTFDGEPQDVVLEAGQSLVCEHDSPLLIAAFGSATWRAD